jgi:hypothetical protein
MTTFLLQHPLQNHRGHSESLAAYRKRRTEGNKAVKAYLKGAAWRHVSARSVKIPALGVDPASTVKCSRAAFATSRSSS